MAWCANAQMRVWPAARGVRRPPQALSRFLGLLFTTVSSGSASREQAAAAGRTAAALGPGAAIRTLERLEEQVAALREEIDVAAR